MIDIDTFHLSKALTERFGLEVDVSSSPVNDGQEIKIIPHGISSTISFRVELHLGWRTITASFIPGNYASELVSGIRFSSESQRSAFAVFADSLESKGAKISLNFDDHLADASEPASWPKDWTTIHISMKKVGVVVEQPAGYDFDAVFPWAAGFLGLAVSLLPLEERTDSPSEGESEGAVLLRVVKQYERSRINRATCIEIHGTGCKICGFNFGSSYGEIGDGFIHVHHVVPISEMEGGYILDPAKDLIPVCPNCHSMLHRRNPALLPGELIQILNKERRGQSSPEKTVM